METITINATVPFIIGRHRDTRLATIAQDAGASADMKAGTLLTPDSNGKLVPCVAEAVGVDPTYPVAVLIADVAKASLVADDVDAYVAYNTILNKELIATVNSHLTIDETFIWESIKNGIDIKEMI